jgi:hypothetical protein
MPDTFYVPLLKLYHRRSSRPARRIGSGPLILDLVFRSAGFEFPENLDQELRATQSILVIKAIDRESSGQIETLLGENITSVSPLVHDVDGDSGAGVVMVIQPQQWIRTAMTRKQRRVNV